MTTYSWTGSGGNDLWSNANDWSPNSGPPQTPDTAVIGIGASVVVNGASGVGALVLGFSLSPQMTGSTLTVDIGDSLEFAGASTVGTTSTLQAETGGTLLFSFHGSFTNSGTVLLGQDFNDRGGSSNLVIDGAVTLTGSGAVDLGEISNSPGHDSTANIENDSSDPSTSDSLVNQNNTISGAGSIILDSFDNQAGGTVEASQPEGSALRIAAGTFSNEGTMVAESRSTLDLGQDGSTGSLTNTGNITVQNLGTLAISGTLAVSGPGVIQLGPGNDQIVSDGNPAVLNLEKQNLKGAGTVGDSNLTLVNGSGSNIIADVFESDLILNTGTNTIINDGMLTTADGGLLDIDSPVENAGTIAAINGLVEIDASVSKPNAIVNGIPAIDIGTGGELELDDNAQVNDNVTFTGMDAELVLNNQLTNGGIGGTFSIIGAEATDSIDFIRVPYSASIQAVWQQNGASGTLSLVEGGSTLASVVLTGQYVNGEFATRQDGATGTAVDVPNPIPPSNTTAVMFMTGSVNGATVRAISDIGSHSILNLYAWGQVGPEWQVVGIGDFSGNPGEADDVMMRDSNTGQFEAYDISNNNLTNAMAAGQIGAPWSIAAFGDFSGNPNETDMLMDEPTAGGQLDYQVFDIRNNQIVPPGGNVGQPGDLGFFGPIGSEWQVIGTGDFSGNPGETDVMTHDNNTGQFEVYDISNNNPGPGVVAGQMGAPWSFVAFGDFSGNPNETDMLMDEPTAGGQLDYQVFDIRNNQIVPPPGGGGNVGQPGDLGFFGPVGPQWQVVGTGDFSGNPGETDLMLRGGDGSFEVFGISNNQYIGGKAAGQIGLEWQVNGVAADPPSAPPSQLAQAMASYGTPGSGALDAGAPLNQTIVQSTMVSAFAPPPG